MRHGPEIARRILLGDNPNRNNSRNTDRIREFQTNIDGQQFQNTMGGGGQPTFSQEMIAEFQPVGRIQTVVTATGWTLGGIPDAPIPPAAK
jgi:hypothetical protein